MHFPEVVAILVAVSSLAAAILPPRPLIGPPYSASLSPPSLSSSSHPTQRLTDWPPISQFVHVLRTDLEFRVFEYGGNRPVIPSYHSPIIARKRYEVEVKLRRLNGSTLGLYRLIYTDHLSIYIAPLQYPSRRNDLTTSEAADLLQQFQLWTLAFGPQEFAKGDRVSGAFQ